MIVRRRISKMAVMKEKQAQMAMSSIEKTNTKEDLARVMTKSRSKMQTVTNGCGS